MIVLVMGVSGVGKTTVGRRVAAALALPFLDADDFHPPANVAKMRAGSPLDDADREPWLRALATELVRLEPKGGAVLACSALKARHRCLLKSGLARSPLIAHLAAERAVVSARIAARTDHFMPATLADSQLAALEAPREALTLDARQPPALLAARIVAAARVYG